MARQPQTKAEIYAMIVQRGQNKKMTAKEMNWLKEELPVLIDRAREKARKDNYEGWDTRPRVLNGTEIQDRKIFGLAWRQVEVPRYDAKVVYLDTGGDLANYNPSIRMGISSEGDVLREYVSFADGKTATVVCNIPLLELKELRIVSSVLHRYLGDPTDTP